MHWIAIGVVCVALIFVSYYSPKIGFGLLAALAVLLTSLYFLNLEDSESKKFPIPKETIVLEVTQTEKSYGDSWEFAGRVSNTSDKNVTDVQVRVLLYDCPAESVERTDACVVIGDKVEFVPINIPTRQARDFTDNVSFRNAVAKGKLFWEFELAGIRVTD